MKNYVSLIIDIENSRGYAQHDRSEMQKFMLECISKMNIAFKGCLKFEIEFSAGDEVQGLFEDLTSALLYLRIFEMLIKPVKIRAGMGIGEWTVKIENGTSTQQDGPAYHRARQAIEEVHKRQTQRWRICSESDHDLINHLVNTSCTLKAQQGYMQNIALTVMEFLYPFEKQKLIVYDYSIIMELLRLKYQFGIGKSRSAYGNRNAKSDGFENFNKEYLNVLEPIMIDGKHFDAEYAIIKKNMSMHVANVLDCKRQNADMLLKRGNSIAIRNMDYIALQYIERMYTTGDL